MNLIAPSSKKYDTLSGLHQHLVDNYSNPPSLITLKRWSADGKLKPAQHTKVSSRTSRAQGADATERAHSKPKYDMEKAAAVINAFWALASKDPVPSYSPSPAPSPSMEAPGMELVLAELARLEKQIEQNTRTLEALTQSTARLDSVRVTLMNKYDAVSAQQGQIIENLRKRVSESEANASLARDVQSVRLGMSRVIDMVGALQSRSA